MFYGLQVSGTINIREVPTSLIRLVGAWLPRFSAEEAKALKGSFDFLGYNYYTTQYMTNNPNPP